MITAITMWINIFLFLRVFALLQNSFSDTKMLHYVKYIWYGLNMEKSEGKAFLADQLRLSSVWMRITQNGFCSTTTFHRVSEWQVEVILLNYNVFSHFESRHVALAFLRPGRRDNEISFTRKPTSSNS